MSDQDQELQTETPQETPQPESDPEGQQTAEETPAEPDSTQNADEQVSREQEQKAYFQTEAQKAKAELKRLREQQYGEEPEPDPEPGPQPPSHGIEDKIAAMNDDELNEYLRDNPAVQLQLQRHLWQQDQKKMFEAYEQKNQFQLEKDRANQTLRNFLSAAKVSDEELQAADQELKSFGIKGSPTAIAGFLIDRIEMNRFKQQGSQKLYDTATKVSQAAKTQALTQQPDGASPSDTKPKTPADIIQQKFGRSRSERVLDGFFGS